MKLNVNVDAVQKKKCWFAQFRYPTPETLEYYLEEMAAEGYSLQPIGEKGMFFYEFNDTKAGKCKFMVDKSDLPKAMYMETMLGKNWELMGQSLNCYVWRQYYEEERPKDMTDSPCLNKHRRNTFFGMLIALLCCIAAIAAFVVGFIIEKKFTSNAHGYYLLEAVILLPFVTYFMWATIKCFKSWRRHK